MKKILYTALFLAFSCHVFSQDNILYGFTVNEGTGEVVAFATPDFTTADLDVSTALFVFTLPSGTATVPGIAPGGTVSMFNNLNDEWEVQRLTSAECDLVPACMGAGLLDDVDVYIARAALPVSMLSTTANTPFNLFSFVITNGCDMGGTIDIIENGSTFAMNLGNAFGGGSTSFNNQFSGQIDNGVETGLYDGNDEVFGMPPCPATLIPTMSQWAFALFGLVIFTLGIVVVYNVYSMKRT